MSFAPICVPCQREMRCRKNDFMFFDYHAAAVWAGDKYGCECCGAEIVIGFGREPVAVRGGPHWADYCVEAVKNLALTRERPMSARSAGQIARAPKPTA